MTQPTILPVILSGGVGSRLWPMSREAHPKPFIKLNDGQSLIQKTYQRAVELDGVEEVITVTNRDLFFYTKDEFEGVAVRPCYNTFLLEPFGRNSTAAIALAAQHAKDKHGSDSVLLILPADHLIEDMNAFKHAVNEAVELTLKGKLVTFGIKPASPETGFGYIEAKGSEVTRFVEKPDLQTAEKYLESGTFFWNSGMFCMSAGDILTEMERLCPEIFQQTFQCLQKARYSSSPKWSQYEVRSNDFESVDDISIDYAIFEKSNKVAIVPCDIGWSDIGSWKEFGALNPSDESGNNVVGDVLLEDTRNCIVQGDGKLVATLGVQDLIIADTADALLIAHKDRSQDVRSIVSKLKKNNSPAYKEFPTVHRPWGSYTILQEGIGFKLKRIEVKSGAKLSLQSHSRRSEHWVIVTGFATVTNGEKTLELEHNQSTYIPIGNKHCIENTGEERLVFIEVQCGDYLGEDDIIRYNDIYGRVE